MKNRLKRFFNFHESEREPGLKQITNSADGKNVLALSDDDLSIVSAAGDLTFDNTIPITCPEPPTTSFGNEFIVLNENSGNGKYSGSASYSSQQSGAEYRGCTVEHITSPTPMGGPIMNDGIMTPNDKPIK